MAHLPGILQLPGVLQQFQTQVALRPAQIAVETADFRIEPSLSYSELDRRSNQLARRLRKEGVGRDSIVAVLSERRPTMIVAILGILKAGGAYLSLDASYPVKRLAWMVEDSQPVLILNTTAAAVPFPPGCKMISLMDEQPQIIDEPEGHVDNDPLPHDLAYLIYTSGSTGKPKGVLLEHTGLSEMAIAHREFFGVCEESRVLQFSSLSFDAAVSEIFMTLSAGGTLCLAKPADLIPGRELIELLERRRISNVLLPPSALATMPDHPLPDLRTLISGGERCTRHLVQRWAEGRDFFNAYGPTEATVTTTIHKVQSDSIASPQAADPPIGIARKYAIAYVLNEARQPVAAGEIGQLFVGGNGVARGYLNRAELTADHFFPDPFQGDRGGTHAPRMYRTGDLVRQRNNGVLEFVGRSDRQVKVRGFRIELGEIESALCEHVAVRQSAAKLVSFADSDSRIVAYVVASQNGQQAADVQPDSLRSWLADRLPQQSIPSRFVLLDSLPLTANQKIDYSSLPETHNTSDAGNGAASTKSHPTPAPSSDSYILTPLQSLIHKSWCDQIGLDPDELAIDGHFVEVGGDSLLAAHIALRLEGSGVPLRAQDVLDHPTVRRLANFLESRV